MKLKIGPIEKYTVDPVNSRDFDDAFGIEMCHDKPYYILSIYISMYLSG